MDLETVTDNPDYHKNGWPAPWQAGYAAGRAGGPAQPNPQYDTTITAWLDGYARGLQEFNNTKENSMTEPTAIDLSGGLDIDGLMADVEKETAETKAEASPTTTTSAGGFALLEGIEADLEKGSGKPWIPEEVGDTLMGVVTGVDTILSDYPNPKTGKQELLPLIDIKGTDGEDYTVRAYGAALSQQIAKRDPHVGDGIAIRFLGMEQPKNPQFKAYKNYVVVVRKPVTAS